MKTLEDVLEEITPTPDPDFVADMEWRMQLGFPPRASAACRGSTSRSCARGRSPRSRRARCWRCSSRVSVTGGGERSGDRPGAPAPARSPRTSPRRRRRVRRARPPRDRPLGAACLRRPAAAAIRPRGRDPPHRALGRSSRSRRTPTSSTASRTRSSGPPTGHDGFVLQLLLHAGRGRLQQRLVRAARPGRPAPADAERPLAACDGARAQRVGHRRHRLVRLDPRPPAHRPGAPREPAAPARAGCHGYRRATRSGGGSRSSATGSPPARPVPRHPGAHRVRDRLRRRSSTRTRASSRARPTKRSTTRSDRSRTSSTSSSAPPACCVPLALAGLLAWLVAASRARTRAHASAALA